MAIIQLSIPIFLGLIVLEVIAALMASRKVYRLADSLVDMSCGMISQFANIAIKLASFGVFAYVASHWSVQVRFGAPAWPDTVVSWVIVFIAVDFGHYWVHRLSHRVNILWAGHAVHHSSEELNFTVAVRNSSLHGLFIWVFFMPLALVGVPWYMFAVSYALNVIYQFWLHTRLIGRLGWLEWVFNTPSHHRVHHGIDTEYLDKNYAGVFIVWDRMFGTFSPEIAEPHYGITTPPGSWNPVWANVHVFVEIARHARRQRGVAQQLRVVFGPPELLAAATRGLRGPTTPPVMLPAIARGYVVVQFAVALIATLLVLRVLQGLSLGEVLASGFVITFALSNLGSMLEGKRWALNAEFIRHLVLGCATVTALVFGSVAPGVAFSVLIVSGGSIAWLVVLRRGVRAPLSVVAG
jgi:sterol desaturase/sphingolipid hydroxylase (fatty acid hydroxylase superfamily)